MRRDGEEAGADWRADTSRIASGVMDVVRLELRPGRGAGDPGTRGRDGIV
ncbi:hypothetical protein ACFWSF_37080 [Streptomyces sp. NPDC058611]